LLANAEVWILVLQILHGSVGILHHDISPNNILFVYDAQGKAKCLLIDFDYAVTVGRIQQASHGFRTVCFPFLPVLSFSSSCSQGTPPFMALEIMLQSGANFKHVLQHDLESLLYVIFWMCNHMIAPGVEHVKGEIPHIHGWCNMGLRLQELGHLKLAHIVDAERIILAELTPYWADFKPFAKELLAAFFPVSPSLPNEIMPERMLAILNKAVSVLEEPEPPRPPKCSTRKKVATAKAQSQSALQTYVTLAGIKRD